MEGLPNTLVDDILIPFKLYEGCFSSDNIPTQLRKKSQFSIICNLSSQEEKGKHFISIIVLSDYVLYIYPTGFPCLIDPIRDSSTSADM